MARKNAGTSRNPLLIRGLNRFSRSTAYHKKGKWVKKSNEWKKQVKKEVAPIVKPFNKTKKPNETRTIQKSQPKYYPVDVVPKKYILLTNQNQLIYAILLPLVLYSFY